MRRCSLAALGWGRGPSGQVPRWAIQTWTRDAYLSESERQRHLRYFYPRSELQKAIDDISPDDFQELLFPTCNCCGYAKGSSAGKFYATLEGAGKDFDIKSLRKTISDFYLSTFFWLIENRIPSYIVYLISNDERGIADLSVNNSLACFDLKRQLLPQGFERSEAAFFKITSKKVQCTLYVNNCCLQPLELLEGEEQTESILDKEIYGGLRSSRSKYFIGNIQCQKLPKLEYGTQLPIPASPKPVRLRLREDGQYGEGEAMIYAIDLLEDIDHNSEHTISRHTTLLETYPYILKVFDDLDLGRREWLAIQRLMANPPPSPYNINFPICGFEVEKSIYIVYPRAICSLYDYLTGHYLNNKQLPNEKIELKLLDSFTDILSSLDDLHSKDMYHLDIHHKNILVMQDLSLVMNDFGQQGSSDDEIEHYLDKPENKPYLRKHETGSPVFMPPKAQETLDSIKKEEDRRQFLRYCDCYSIGRVIFEVALHSTEIALLERLTGELYKECEDEDSLRRYSLCRHDENRNIVTKDVVNSYLNQLQESSSTIKEGGHIDLFLLSQFIRSLLDIDYLGSSPVKLKLGKSLHGQYEDCLARKPDLPFQPDSSSSSYLPESNTPDAPVGSDFHTPNEWLNNPTLDSASVITTSTNLRRGGIFSCLSCSFLKHFRKLSIIRNTNDSKPSTEHLGLVSEAGGASFPVVFQNSGESFYPITEPRRQPTYSGWRPGRTPTFGI